MKNYIYTVIGPSGSGKTTISAGNFPPEQTLVSFTTREPRPGEIDGIDYYFVTLDNVNDMESKNLCLEHIVYNGNHYGYTKDEFKEKLSEGDVVAVVNIDGYKDFKAIEEYSDLIKPVFIKISKDEVIRHMEFRNDSKENIEKRISFFDEEANNESYFREEGAFILDINGLTIEESIAAFNDHITKMNELKKD